MEENNDAPAERTVKTSMTADEEVAAFMEEWDSKWKPSVDESVVAKAQEVQQPIQSIVDRGAGVSLSQDNEDGRPEDQKAEESNVGAENTIQKDNNWLNTDLITQLNEYQLKTIRNLKKYKTNLLNKSCKWELCKT